MEPPGGNFGRFLLGPAAGAHPVAARDTGRNSAVVVADDATAMDSVTPTSDRKRWRRKQDRRLDRRFDKLEQVLPNTVSDRLAWLRTRRARWVRVPVGLLLMAGGVFSFLPVLGVWMLPLGLLLLAIDIPLLKAPMNRFMIWGERKIQVWRRWWQGRRGRRDARAPGVKAGVKGDKGDI